MQETNDLAKTVVLSNLPRMMSDALALVPHPLPLRARRLSPATSPATKTQSIVPGPELRWPAALRAEPRG